MSLFSQLRIAAAQGAEVVIVFAGRDPDELVALARTFGDREGRVTECIVRPDQPGQLIIRFQKSFAPSE